MENNTLSNLTLILSSLNTICQNLTCDNKFSLELQNNSYESEHNKYNELIQSIKGKNIKVVTFQNLPLNGAYKDENGNWNGTGIAFVLLNLLSKKYEFNYTIVLPTENILGNNNKGVFGMLASGEADVAAAFLPILPWLRDAIEYSSQLDVGEWVVLLKRPSESATGSGLLAPFDYQVWILIFISLALVGPIIYLIILLRDKLCPGNEKNNVYPLPSCIWFVYGALLKQGTTLNPASDSSRLLFATWWIFITILTAFYTANLTAFLTLSKFTLPIERPEDIAKKNYKWIAQKGLAVDEVIEFGTELSFLKKSRNGIFSNADDTAILKNYVDNDFMYIRDKPGVDHIMYRDYLNKTKMKITEKFRCTYVITTWPVIKLSRAFAFKKKFQWISLFNEVLSTLVESGIVKHRLTDDLPDTTICPQNLGDKSRQLHNSDLLMTYKVVAGGFIISLIAFVGEILYRRCEARNLETKFLNRMDTNNKFPFSPPSYYALFQPTIVNSVGKNIKAKKQIINGRDYWVVKLTNGDTKLIPVRTPSALLFQYTQ